jgi:microcystin-dependent protein
VGQLPAHNHNVTGNTSEGGAHTHNFRAYHANFDHAGSASEGSTKNDGDGEFTDTGAVLSAGNHSHTFNVTSGNAGSGESFSNLPPFYALAFIMRVQ